MSTLRRARVAFVLGVALVGLLLVGCGTTNASSSNSSTAGNAACQYLASINQALTKLSTLGNNATVGDVKSAQQKLTPALNALASLPFGKGSAIENLKAANDQLAAAVKDLPDSTPVSQVSSQLQALKNKIAPAQDKVAKLSSTLNCTS